MTDLVNSAPLAIRHLRLPRVRLPKLDIGAAIAALSTGIRQAFCMAYVEPFNALQRRPSIPDDVDLEGRDPNW
jgi:hypothetical protein